MSQKEEQKNDSEQSTDKPFKRSVEVFDDENSIIVDDEYDVIDFKFFPQEKKFKITDSIKDDPHHNYLTYEYKISAIPTEIYIRLLESSHTPPEEYSVRDGVVLESEIIKRGPAHDLENLKRQVEWHKANFIWGHFEIDFFILSRHPEIISPEDYRKFLRQSVERIKKSVVKVEEAVEKDNHNLQIHSYDSGKGIWYPDNELEKKDSEAYWDLPKEKRDQSPYGKKLKYVEEFNISLFSETASSYVGISENEFKNSDKIVEYIQKLLDKKDEPTKKEVEPKISKTKGFIFSLILTFLLSWVVSWFVDINPFLIFIIVQIIAFAQSIIGNWIGKILEK